MDNEAPITRPSADDFLSIIRRQQLGKLKIYLGACPALEKPMRCWRRDTA